MAQFLEEVLSLDEKDILTIKLRVNLAFKYNTSTAQNSFLL
jgi:hypothetical protein